MTKLLLRSSTKQSLDSIIFAYIGRNRRYRDNKKLFSQKTQIAVALRSELENEALTVEEMVANINSVSWRFAALTDAKSNWVVKHGHGRAAKMITECISILSPLLQASVRIPETQKIKMMGIIKSNRDRCKFRAKIWGVGPLVSSYYAKQKEIFDLLLLSMDAFSLTYKMMLIFLQHSYTQLKQLQLECYRNENTNSTGITKIRQLVRMVVPNTNFVDLYNFDDFITEMGSMGRYKPFAWAYNAFNINKREIFKNHRLEKILYLIYVGKVKPSLFRPDRGEVKIYCVLDKNMVSSNANYGGRLVRIHVDRIKNYNPNHPVGVGLDKNLLIVSQGIKILECYKIGEDSIERKKFGFGPKFYKLLKELSRKSPDQNLAQVDEVQRRRGGAVMERMIYGFLLRIGTEDLGKDIIMTTLELFDRLDEFCLVTTQTIFDEMVKLLRSDVYIKFQKYAAIPLSQKERDEVFETYKPEVARGITEETKKLFFLIFRVLEIGLEQAYSLEVARNTTGNNKNTWVNSISRTVQTVSNVTGNVTKGVYTMQKMLYGMFDMPT
ncbi:MAG: hypothetical protein GY710_23785 [Desulfobacteraceae bacterium]|nr:hypothetical protein [Desulfobacteraceae bacterium]